MLSYLLVVSSTSFYHRLDAKRLILWLHDDKKSVTLHDKNDI